jgi:transcriptional regulator with XRE-family HTH domain
VTEEESRKKILGRAARTARERAGYRKRPAFARATGLSVRTIAAVELGEEGAGGRESRAVFAEAVGWNPADVEDYIEGRREEPPTTTSAAPSAFSLDAGEILTAPREEIIKLSRVIERVSGSAIAEKFLLDALELRRQHAERGGIEPSTAEKRDVG